MARRYFGTDGVRGVVGEDLTPELVERLGRAATLWCGGGAIFIGRDTRGSGRELERAFASGVASAGGNAVLAGVLPTPAVALLALDLGVVVSASHNPPEYNGIKFFHHTGRKLTDAEEEEIEALLDAPPRDPEHGQIDDLEVAVDSYLDHVLERFGAELDGLRIGVDCANGAYSWIAPRAFERLGAEVAAIGIEPDGTNINVRLRRHRPAGAPAARPRGAARPRSRVRRGRRPHARGGRVRRPRSTATRSSPCSPSTSASTSSSSPR